MQISSEKQADSNMGAARRPVIDQGKCIKWEVT
jgi:hypothetical protein